MHSRLLNPWSLTSVLICLLVLVPLALVLTGSVQTGEEWEHVRKYNLEDYLRNTGVLIVLVSLMALLFALPCAWLVSHCEFWGRRVLEWLLVLPLAIPTYVAAIVYRDVPEQAFPLLLEIRQEHGVEAFLQAELVVRYGTLAMLMAGVLFPYLYLSLRASFAQQRQYLSEASRMLGRSGWETLWRVVIPLTRPAIAAGLSLIIMEVINDYGAVYLFTIPTLTDGIFRTWHGLRDQESAVRLAMMGLLAVLIIISLERLLRGRARFSENLFHSAALKRKKLGIWGNLGALWCCLLPLSVGLFFPLWRLIPWAWQAADEVLGNNFWEQMGRSSALALSVSLIVSLAALLLVYAARLQQGKWLFRLQHVATLGYAIPGAVIAIGVMIFLGKVDDWRGEAWLSGTIYAIGFAYLVRFLAVSYQPVQAGFAQIKADLDESSRLLGNSSSKTLWKVHLPLLRTTLLGAVMLAFVDMLKELPLTMILRPANFETLSTLAFGYATEGHIQQAAVPSLLIVLLGAAALILLNWLMKPRERQTSQIP